MFERFTDRARRVMVLAQEEARDLGHDHIGTEHLLLGILHEGEGVGAIEEHLRYRELLVGDEAGAEPRAFVVIYCGMCGRALAFKPEE